MALLYRYLFFALLLSLECSAEGLTGNWVVSQDMHDGTFRALISI